jgi:hypothetical protein
LSSGGAEYHNIHKIVLYILAYADDVNMLGGSIHTLRREIGLEVSAYKTKYMVMS